MPESESTLLVAAVTGAHGIHGAVRVKLFDPQSESLHPGLQVELRDPQSNTRERHTIVDVNVVPGSDRARVRFENLEHREGAEALRGREIHVRREDLPDLAEDEFFLADAVGCEVIQVDEDGRERSVGTVAGITSNGAQDLFEVAYTDRRGRRRTWLLPVLPAFIRELEQERLLVSLMPGMLPDDLEAP